MTATATYLVPEADRPRLGMDPIQWVSYPLDHLREAEARVTRRRITLALAVVTEGPVDRTATTPVRVRVGWDPAAKAVVIAPDPEGGYRLRRQRKAGQIGRSWFIESEHLMDALSGLGVRPGRYPARWEAQNGWWVLLTRPRGEG